MIFTELTSMFNLTHSFYATLFIVLLWWIGARVKKSDRNSEKREERLVKQAEVRETRLINKVDEMEKRYIEREDKYQEVVNILSIEIVHKVDNIVNDVEEIKEAIKNSEINK